MPFLPRRSPCGPRILAPSIAPGSSFDGWTLAAPLVLTLLSPGHTPGIYTVSKTYVPRILPSAGSIQLTVTTKLPNGGPIVTVLVQTFSLAALATPGDVNAISFPTDGTTAVTLTYTPVGVTGSPLANVYAAAMLLGALS